MKMAKVWKPLRVVVVPLFPIAGQIIVIGKNPSINVLYNLEHFGTIVVRMCIGCTWDGNYYDVNLSASQEEVSHGPEIEISKNCQALFNSSTASEKYMYKTSQKSSPTTLKAHGQYGQHGQLELPGHLVCSPQEVPKWSHMYILSSRSITMYKNNNHIDSITTCAIFVQM